MSFGARLHVGQNAVGISRCSENRRFSNARNPVRLPFETNHLRGRLSEGFWNGCCRGGLPAEWRLSTKAQSSLLKVPGAQTYYEEQGSGPVLLMIPGGPADAGIFAALASLLAAQYAVVRYDPRGNSRSVLDGPPQDPDVNVHGDDAAQLLDELGGEPAYVLGSSGGAQIGLNLAARYPARVLTLVAHEPPCMELLPEAAQQRAFTDAVYNTYLTEGAGPPCRNSWPAQASPAAHSSRLPSCLRLSAACA
jgi:pimeloyl-ACP methyl ester carboxylesterase